MRGQGNAVTRNVGEGGGWSSLFPTERNLIWEFWENVTPRPVDGVKVLRLSLRYKDRTLGEKREGLKETLVRKTRPGEKKGHLLSGKAGRKEVLLFTGPLRENPNTGGKTGNLHLPSALSGKQNALYPPKD